MLCYTSPLPFLPRTRGSPLPFPYFQFPYKDCQLENGMKVKSMFECEKQENLVQLCKVCCTISSCLVWQAMTSAKLGHDFLLDHTVDEELCIS